MSYRWFLLVFLLICAASSPVLAQFDLKLNKGLAAYLRKDYQGAIKHLEEALVENPQSAVANHIIGLSLLRLTKYKESITYLEKAKSLDPTIKGINLDLGTAYLRIGNFKRALGEFEEAVRRDPQSGLAYYNMGYTQFRLGNYKKAIAALDKASELDPDLALQSHFYAGLSRYRLANYQEAKVDFESVQELGPATYIAAIAKEYLDTIARLTKRYYGTVSTGMQYDSNVVLEPDEVEITDEDDVRAVFFLNLGYKPYLTPDIVIGGDYTGYFSFNKDIEEFNIQNHLINLYGEREVFFRGTPLTFSLDYFYDIVLIDGSPADDLFSQSHSVIPKVSVQVASYTSTEFSYEFRYDNFKDFPERDAVNNNWTIAQVFSLYDGRLGLKPGFNITINSANDVEDRRNFDYVAPAVFLEVIAFLPFELTTFIDTLYIIREDYYNDPFDRVDNQIGVRVVVSKKLYEVLSLDVGYQYISNPSDSDFPGPEPFEYSRDIFSVTLNARF